MADDELRAMWARGSYAIVGDWFAAASRACLDGLDLGGTRVLDVACGTGAVALEAARRGAHVVGIDLTPELLEEAARRGALAGVAVDWQQGSFTDLSVHRDIDVTTSAFGVMFAADQAAVAGEVLRTVRPGGTVVIAAWAPDGAFGFAAPGILDLLPAMGAGPDRTRWATEDGLVAIVAEARDLDTNLHAHLENMRAGTIAIPFDSVEAAVVAMRRWSGPWMALFDALAAGGQSDAGHAALVDHLAGFADPTDTGIELAVTYSIGRLRRR